MSRLPPLPPVKGATWVREEVRFGREVRHEWHLKADVPVPDFFGGFRTATLGRIWREPNGTWEGVALSGRCVYGRTGLAAAVWVARCARADLRLAKEVKP